MSKRGQGAAGIRLERDGAIASIVVDRPAAKNAIDREAMAELDHICGALEADAEIAAAILTGAGGFFIAGGDLKDFDKIPSRAEGRRMSLWMQAIVNRLDALPCPTIAAIDGAAYGGGCELALACDMRVIAKDARMVFKQNAMGLTPGWGGGQRLARLVGRSRAMLLFATAATVSAEEADRIGLVDRVAPASSTALEEARSIAREIAKNPRLAVRATKRALIRGAEMPLREAIDFEAELFAETWESEEHRAARRAFLEKAEKK